MVTLKATSKGSYFAQVETREDGTVFIVMRKAKFSPGEALTAQDIIDEVNNEQ